MVVFVQSFILNAALTFCNVSSHTLINLAFVSHVLSKKDAKTKNKTTLQIFSFLHCFKRQMSLLNM